ncbi:MAG: YitT family protein [Acidimicrobiia bacterium]
MTLRTGRSFEVQAAAFLIGSACVGLGVGMMVNADLGVTPADVTNTGIAAHVGLGVGTIAWALATTVAFIAWALGRAPSVGTFVSSLLIGVGVNGAIAVLPEPGVLGFRVLMLAGGLAALYTGIVSIVASGRGTGPLELLMLAVHDRGVKVHRARWAIEATLLVAGVLLGGQIGLGTALFAGLTGPVLASVLPLALRWMGTEDAVPMANAGRASANAGCAP